MKTYMRNTMETARGNREKARKFFYKLTVAGSDIKLNCKLQGGTNLNTSDQGRNCNAFKRSSNFTHKPIIFAYYFDRST